MIAGPARGASGDARAGESDRADERARGEHADTPSKSSRGEASGVRSGCGFRGSPPQNIRPAEPDQSPIRGWNERCSVDRPRPGPDAPGSVVACASPPGTSTRSAAGRPGADWLGREDVDVLALQEIKCTPEQFPFDAFGEAGYEVELHGLNQWNGVAIASRFRWTTCRSVSPACPASSRARRAPTFPSRRARSAPRSRGPGLEPLRSQRAGAGRPALAYKLDWLATLAGHPRTGWPPIPTSRSP